MYNSQEIAATIKSVAKEKGIRVGIMLPACGLNKNALSTMQSGGYLPRIESLVKIADYLDCSVDFLLGRTAVPTFNRQDNNSGNIVNGSNGDNSPLTVQNSDLADTEKEINSILSELTYRERHDLMELIYKFADEHKK